MLPQPSHPLVHPDPEAAAAAAAPAEQGQGPAPAAAAQGPAGVKQQPGLSGSGFLLTHTTIKHEHEGAIFRWVLS